MGESMGRVLPFARSAEYLLKLGDKQRDQGNALKALELYRLAERRAPGDTRARLCMARAYADMRCAESANRILLPLLSEEGMEEECLFLLGCNFFNMGADSLAGECLMQLLARAPGGVFAHRAVELQAQIIAPSLYDARDRSLARRVSRAMRAMDEDKPALAIRLLRRAKSAGRRNPNVYAMEAFAHLDGRSLEERGAPDDACRLALQSARTALRLDSENLYARCAMAAALCAHGMQDASDRFLKRALDGVGEDAESLWMVGQTACRTRSHALAREALSRLEREAPYADALLHMLACALHNTGAREDAVRCWKLLRRIDPSDSVAETRSRLAAEGALPETLPYSRQTPLPETLARLTRLRAAVQEGPEALAQRWAEDEELEMLLRWGLTTEEPGVARAMLGVLISLGDARAQRLLRAFLADLDRTDAFKHEALVALGATGARGPIHAIIGGHLATATIAVSERADSAHRPVPDLLTASVARRLPVINRETLRTARALANAVSADDLAARSLSFWARAITLALAWTRGEPMRAGRKLERSARRMLRQIKEGQA